MSAPRHLQRCREWITEQLEGMTTLRNASPRDPSFKAWRQNTLTTLQRIWPDLPARSERFRRIVFSPPSAKADGRQMREWFGRGLAESRTYLTSLLDLIDSEGVPEASSRDRDRSVEVLTDEVSSPLRDLASGGEAPAEEPATPARSDGGIDVTPGYDTHDEQVGHSRDPKSPAPPALEMNWQSMASGKPRRTEATPPAPPPLIADPDITPEPEDAESAEPIAEVPLTPKQPAPPKRFMPGVAAPAAQVPAPKPADAPTARTSMPAPPNPTVRPAAPAPSRVQAGAPTSREPASRVMQRPKQGKGKPKKPASKEKLKDLLGFDEFEVRARASEAEAQSAPPNPQPAPISSQRPVPVFEPPTRFRESEPDDTDDEVRERATLDFMQNSAVFGLTGKPVQRRTDTTDFLDPDAVAVATLATDVPRLGVPVGLQAAARVHLLDVARRLEAGDLPWSLLRETVTDAMDYPELARRLLPILLPWLERAA